MSVQSHNINRLGYQIIPNVFDPSEVDEMRQCVLHNLHYMSNTRPTKSAHHVAGFHRFPELEPLHSKISGKKRIVDTLGLFYCQKSLVALGLTDITVNRSQPWHTDLLRGRYARYIDARTCWSGSSELCLKVLVYLQSGDSLQVVTGSHATPINLSRDAHAVPDAHASVERVNVNAGDVVLMDIRAVHRGATEQEMSNKGLGADAKILISTVFGERAGQLAQSIQIGNAHRLADWDNHNR